MVIHSIYLEVPLKWQRQESFAQRYGHFCLAVDPDTRYPITDFSHFSYGRQDIPAVLVGVAVAVAVGAGVGVGATVGAQDARKRHRIM